MLAASLPDAVIAMRCPLPSAPPGPTRWFGLQYTLEMADMIAPSGLTYFDAIGMHSGYWWERAPSCLRIRAFNRSIGTGRPPEPVDDAVVRDTLARRASLVGIPEMDQCHWIEPDEARRRLGLDPERPVVLYIPFQFKSIAPRTFWLKHINPRGRVWQQAAVWLSGDRAYQQYVDGGWSDRGVVRALRGFCDRNGAALIVKGRAKDPVPRYLARCADRVLNDEHDYPATILELLRISALCCINSFSTVTYEAAYAGVPSVCIAPSGDDLGFWPIWREWFLNTDAGGSFNFPGVVWPLALREFVEDFGARRIDDFPLDAAARAQYVEKFIGFDDGKSSDRVLDAVQSLVERAPRTREIDRANGSTS